MKLLLQKVSLVVQFNCVHSYFLLCAINAFIVVLCWTQDNMYECRYNLLHVCYFYVWYILTTDPENEESEPSKVLSAVRFGWNSVFSVDSASNKQLSDADIERIIDRTRGGAALTSCGNGNGSGGVNSDKGMDGEQVQVVGAGEY